MRGKIHAKRGVMEVKRLVEGPADSEASAMKVSMFQGQRGVNQRTWRLLRSDSRVHLLDRKEKR